MKSVLASALLAASFLVGCGPGVSPGGEDDVGGDDDPGGGPDARDCVPTGPEVCSGALDEDCDGFFDCTDVDCYGVGSCPSGNPSCGTLDLTEGQPLALPDSNTIDSHPTCTPVTGYPQYTSSINFTGFSDGQTLEQATDILGICVNMEHSYVKDMQIEMQCPNGATVVLNQFTAPTGPELYAGVPNDLDGSTPTPGTGYDYCWTNTATQTMPLYPSAGGFTATTIPAGNYASSCPIASFEGCPLNGSWTIKVTDMYADDNGFIFSWGINFDPAIVENCDDWPVD